MEDTTIKDVELEEEEIPDQFLCCVCLELLHKPIVLSCGHISCFWCVHKSMNNLGGSHCPICRDPYFHFPTVCRKLHFLLKKIYPVAHKKREEQVLKEEQKLDCFSPQIDVVLDQPKAKGVSDEQKMEECSSDGPCGPLGNEEPKDAKTLSVHETDLPKNNNKVSKQVSKEDLLCSACDKLLVRPVVLNCGHVYCEGCVVDMAGESEKIKCQECHVCDPRGFPKVCLVLEQFLEENFSEEYTLRKSGIHKSPAHNSKGKFQSYNKEGTSLSENNDKDLPWWANPGSDIHVGAGCDSCGVYPIIGDRYRCKDCKEEMGYDLCKECYETPSKVPGRFNQQHTPDHKFEHVDVPQLIHLNSIGFFLGPMVTTGGVNAGDGTDTDESEEEPSGSNESPSST